MSAISPSALTDLDTLKSSIAGGTNFNTSSFINAITTATTDITAMIDNFKNGVIPDVTDTDSVAALVMISKRQDFDSSCAVIMADSWVLSTLNSSFTSCQLTGGTPINPGSCTSKGAFQAGTAAGCTAGCVDTSLILNQFYYNGDAQGSFLSTTLNTRYPAACATTFKTHFGNVWDNYYFYKVPPMVAISRRWTIANTSITDVQK